MVGNIAGGVLCIGIAYAVARWMQRRGGHAKLPKTPIVIGVILAVIGVSGSLSRTLSASGILEEPIEPMVVRQPADGITEADITPVYAAELRDHLVERLRANLPAEAQMVAESSANIVAVGEKRIGVIRLGTAGEEGLVSVFGLQGGDLVRVTCAGSGAAADYRSPPCAAAIRNALGVELP
jgi:hypothetical protein